MSLGRLHSYLYASNKSLSPRELVERYAIRLKVAIEAGDEKAVDQLWAVHHDQFKTHLKSCSVLSQTQLLAAAIKYNSKIWGSLRENVSPEVVDRAQAACLNNMRSEITAVKYASSSAYALGQAGWVPSLPPTVTANKKRKRPESAAKQSMQLRMKPARKKNKESIQIQGKENKQVEGSNEDRSHGVWSPVMFSDSENVTQSSMISCDPLLELGSEMLQQISGLL